MAGHARAKVRPIVMLAIIAVGIAGVSLSSASAAKSPKKIARQVAKKLIAQDNETKEGIFVGSRSGPVAVSPPDDTIGELSLPSGSFGIVVKAQAVETSGSSNNPLTCRLLADGAELDVTTVRVSGPSSAEEALVLIGGHTFASPGVIRVSCTTIFAMEARNIKILAIRGPNASALVA